MLINSRDWMLSDAAFGEPGVRLNLLDDDVRSVQIAFREYRRIVDAIVSQEPEAHVARIVELFHQAKVFVCAMRRVGRLAEALSANRTVFGPAASQRIKVAWKKKRALFDAYIEPRNAIEHIDGEIKGKTNWVMMNLQDDELFVTETKSAAVSREAEKAAVELRNEIVTAVVTTESHTGAA